jgi:hypothetical protein
MRNRFIRAAIVRRPIVPAAGATVESRVLAHDDHAAAAERIAAAADIVARAADAYADACDERAHAIRAAYAPARGACCGAPHATAADHERARIALAVALGRFAALMDE